MQKSPLQIVQERFENKAGLVAAVKKLATDDLFVDELNEEKGFEHVPNAKLLHLHDVLTEVKKSHGSRSKLIDAIVGLEKREKDAEYRTRFESWPTPRLLDYYRSAERSGGRRGPARSKKR